MSEFQSALVTAAAVLAAKSTVVGLLSVRSRLIKDDFASGRPSNKAMEEDGKMPEFLSKLCVDGLRYRVPVPAGLNRVWHEWKTEQHAGL